MRYNFECGQKFDWLKTGETDCDKKILCTNSSVTTLYIVVKTGERYTITCDHLTVLKSRNATVGYGY